MGDFPEIVETDIVALGLASRLVRSNGQGTHRVRFSEIVHRNGFGKLFLRQGGLPVEHRGKGLSIPGSFNPARLSLFVLRDRMRKNV